jgi:hypothetical protein
MNRAKKAKLKKLIVAVAPSAARITGERRMKRAPAITRPDSSVAAGGSTGSIRRRNTAETRNETASTTSAYGAVSSWTSRPPAGGPAAKEKARLPCRKEFAST